MCVCVCVCVGEGGARVSVLARARGWLEGQKKNKKTPDECVCRHRRITANSSQSRLRARGQMRACADSTRQLQKLGLRPKL